MHSGRPCHWHVFCGKATGPGTWTLRQACKRYQQGVESSLLPFPVCTFSSVYFSIAFSPTWGMFLKLLRSCESIRFIKCSFLWGALAWGCGQGLHTAPVGLDLSRWHWHPTELSLSFLYSLYISFPLQIVVFPAEKRKPDFHVELECLLLRLMSLSCENGFGFPFSFLLFSARDNPVFTAR